MWCDRVAQNRNDAIMSCGGRVVNMRAVVGCSWPNALFNLAIDSKLCDAMSWRYASMATVRQRKTRSAGAVRADGADAASHGSYLIAADLISPGRQSCARKLQ